MRAVVQRVKKASVSVGGALKSDIGEGLLVLLGVGVQDNEDDVFYLADKITNLRVFKDQNNKMNFSLMNTRGSLLIVSQFTLYGDCRKGKRPGYSKAAPPDRAEQLYSLFVKRCKDTGLTVKTGVFGAMMDVELCNSGPVTLLLDSSKD